MMSAFNPKDSNLLWSYIMDHAATSNNNTNNSNNVPIDDNDKNNINFASYNNHHHHFCENSHSEHDHLVLHSELKNDHQNNDDPEYDDEDAAAARRVTFSPELITNVVLIPGESSIKITLALPWIAWVGFILACSMTNAVTLTQLSEQSVTGNVPKDHTKDGHYVLFMQVSIAGCVYSIVLSILCSLCRKWTTIKEEKEFMEMSEWEKQRTIRKQKLLRLVRMRSMRWPKTFLFVVSVGWSMVIFSMTCWRLSDKKITVTLSAPLAAIPLLIIIMRWVVDVRARNDKSKKVVMASDVASAVLTLLGTTLVHVMASPGADKWNSKATMFSVASTIGLLLWVFIAKNVSRRYFLDRIVLVGMLVSVFISVLFWVVFAPSGGGKSSDDIFQNWFLRHHWDIHVLGITYTACISSYLYICRYLDVITIFVGLSITAVTSFLSVEHSAVRGSFAVIVPCCILCAMSLVCAVRAAFLRRHVLLHIRST